MATVRLVESTDTDVGYGYLTIYHCSQIEIEDIIKGIVANLNKSCVDENGTPSWCIEDILSKLKEQGYAYIIAEEFEVSI